MRINPSMMLQQSGNVSLIEKSLSKVLGKMSSGKKIQTASDDAAGLAVAKRLEAMSRGYKSSGANIEDAMSSLQIADGGADGMGSILQRQRELAIQASSDTLTDSDRAALDEEYQQLNEELGRYSDSTQYNTQSLLNGKSPLSDGSGQFQVGPNANQQMDAPQTDLSSLATGSIASAAGARSAVATIDSSMETVNGARANLGASGNRLESAARLNSLMEINTADAQSRMEDLDYAQATMDLARNDLLSQTSIQASRHFQQISRNTVLGLLQ